MRLTIFGLLAVLLLSGALTGCYYVQAARGQLEVLNKREPIADVIADPDTPEELARRLSLLADARQFSIDELGLPDNKSYTSYSDLDREYVVWNVIAAPALSIEAKTWCYPVAGCVAYRGYFSKEKAQKKSASLKDQGNDVFVGGATAYSTLGNFNDPVLSTMLKRRDTDLVALLFHELAHQELYVKGDTAFNESFATAVEELGVERWLRSRGREDDYAAWQEYKRYADDVTALALAARRDLEALYDSERGEAEKLAAKAARIEGLTDAINARAREAGVDPTGWWDDQPINNARLAVWSAYESQVPAFRMIFLDCSEDFSCLYARAKEIGELDADARAERLANLVARTGTELIESARGAE